MRRTGGGAVVLGMLFVVGRAWAQVPGAPPASRPMAPASVAPAPGVSAAASAVPPSAPAASLAKTDYGKPEKLDYRMILSGYKDNYFISGFTHDSEVKFQFSIKMDLWPNRTNHSVFFGYTQKSIWNLYRESSPIVDNNYNPELFYGYAKHYGDIIWQPGRVVWFIDSGRVGFEHESNGRDGDASRAWNRIYGYLNAGAYLGTDHYVTLAGKGWLCPFWMDDRNNNITSYRGYGEATLVYGYDPARPHWWGGGHVSVMYFQGAVADLARHGLEADLQWRPAYGNRVSWWRLTPNFYAQLFQGYGEYLLAYDQKETAFRIGISFDDRVAWVDRAPSP